MLTGTGDVLEPEGGVMGIGSGGNYALAAAKALMDTPIGAEEIARKAMAIAAEICVYTNTNVVIEALESAEAGAVSYDFHPMIGGRSAADAARGWGRRMCARGGASRRRSSAISAT